MLHQGKTRFKKISAFLLFFALIFFGVNKPGFAEIKLIDNKEYVLGLSSYLRIDTVTLKNNIDLDSKNSDDTSTYVGYDYSLAFDFKRKESGQEFFLKLESNGPYDYDAPLFIHNTLRTSADKIDRYRNEELLPRVEEFWLDSSIPRLPLRIKSGLYAYEVGHGISLTGAYENYGVTIYSEKENFKWRFYYSRPDLVYKSYLGERPKQDKQQGVDYERALANFFALDSQISFQHNIIQPYVGVLLDTTNAKRVSVFSTPTHKDILGTFGTYWAGNFDKLSLSFEAAHNFGKAKSSDEAFKDVEHTGYAFYTSASYALDKFSPHSRFFYASGNKITTEMIDNGAPALTSGKNRAFSVYSPFNTTTFDSHDHSFGNLPLVAMGNGYGLNYGISWPSTFSDTGALENIILTGLGLDYAFSEKLSFALDWWYLRAAEKGIGTFDTMAKELSTDLGHEVDFSCNYALNNHVSLALYSGYFFPGAFYKEERDDTSGDSLFTPFVRGDGEANGAYQIELSLSLSF